MSMFGNEDELDELDDEDEEDLDLFSAIIRNKINIVKNLLEHGEDPNTTDTSGESALVMAVGYDDINLVKLLLEYGADPTTSVFIAACSYRDTNVNILKELLKHKKINFNEKDNQGNTLLIHASEAGNLDIVKELIKYGANINSKNNEDTTALILASKRGHHNIVVYLVNHGADVNIISKNYETVYNTAAVDKTRDFLLAKRKNIIKYSQEKLREMTQLKLISDRLENKGFDTFLKHTQDYLFGLKKKKSNKKSKKKSNKNNKKNNKKNSKKNSKKKEK